MSTLPERHDPIPYVGWKYARLIWIPGDHFMFCGVNAGQATQYGIRAKAECLRTGEHHTEPYIPSLQCMCGFYAMALPDPNFPNGFSADRVALEVELGGRVIVCSDGYRAEWQRILTVTVPRVCFACGGRAEALGVVDEGQPYHAVAWCAEHLAGKRPITVEHVAQDLGIGVTWGAGRDPETYEVKDWLTP